MEKTKEKTGQGALFSPGGRYGCAVAGRDRGQSLGRTCPLSSVAVRAPAAGIAFTP